jgi:hypothetical protein
VSLPAAEIIGDYAFMNTGTTTLTVTLGNAPSVGINMFDRVTLAKDVTILASEMATGYSTNWRNGFLGRGWNGTSLLTGTVNANINLTVERF